MADNNLQASFKKLMRYAQNLAEYEQGIAEGIIDENVFVIVLEEKVAKFKGQTFEWSGGGDELIRPIYTGEADELTEEQKQYNIETRNKALAGENFTLIMDGLSGYYSIRFRDEPPGEEYVVAIFKNNLDGAIIYFEIEMNADGNVGLLQFGGALQYCFLQSQESAQMFFEGKNIILEIQGIITGEDGTIYEVDSYNLESRFVEYNKGDKRYRVMFDAAYNITEEIDITPAPEVDLSTLATKDELAEAEEVHAAALNDLNDRIENIPSVEIDAELSADSENAIQNKVVTAAINTKVDKVSGKQLSTEDFTTALKAKLEGLSNYDDTTLANAISGLEARLNTLVSGDASTAIESFNEFVAFLSGITDTQTLAGIVASLEQMIAAKQDKIDDLDAIRSGAEKGATAIQNVKTINGEEIVGEGNIEINVDTSTLATKEELTNLQNEIIANEEVHAAALNDLEERKADKEYVEDALGNIDLSAKQDKIDDLDAIRSGAALGATAIQQVKTINGEEITGEGNIEIKADVDTSTLVTKEEFTDVEEVWAASYNLLNQKISDVQRYIYDEAASRRQFDEAIAEIQSIIAENESVVTAAWNQLNTRINALEAAQ